MFKYYFEEYWQNLFNKWSIIATSSAILFRLSRNQLDIIIYSLLLHCYTYKLLNINYMSSDSNLKKSLQDYQYYEKLSKQIKINAKLNSVLYLLSFLLSTMKNRYPSFLTIKTTPSSKSMSQSSEYLYALPGMRPKSPNLTTKTIYKSHLRE